MDTASPSPADRLTAVRSSSHCGALSACQETVREMVMMLRQVWSERTGCSEGREGGGDLGAASRDTESGTEHWQRCPDSGYHWPETSTSLHQSLH